MKKDEQTAVRGEAGISDAGRGSELALRFASGAMLAAMALTLTWAGVWWFTALVGAGVLVLGWEWGRLVRGASFDPLAGWHMAASVLASGLTAANAAGWALGMVGAGALLALALRAPAGDYLSALGFLYTGLPAIALIWLRADAGLGLAAVLFVFTVVWTSDSMAYASGRLIGGPKLWPRISPGKTWAGLAGGAFSSALIASIFALLLGGTSSLALALTGLLLALISQGGDLVESALKRRFGFKNASELIPGHGGLLDRVDGLVLAALAAALLGLALDPSNPGAALLTWS